MQENNERRATKRELSAIKRYETSKSTHAAKLETKARRQVRASKYGVKAAI